MWYKRLLYIVTIGPYFITCLMLAPAVYFAYAGVHFVAKGDWPERDMCDWLDDAFDGECAYARWAKKPRAKPKAAALFDADYIASLERELGMVCTCDSWEFFLNPWGGRDIRYKRPLCLYCTRMKESA